MSSSDENWEIKSLVWGLGLIAPPFSLLLPLAYYTPSMARWVSRRAARSAHAAQERMRQAKAARRMQQEQVEAARAARAKTRAEAEMSARQQSDAVRRA